MIRGLSHRIELAILNGGSNGIDDRREIGNFANKDRRLTLLKLQYLRAVSDGQIALAVSVHHPPASYSPLPLHKPPTSVILPNPLLRFDHVARINVIAHGGGERLASRLGI